MNPIITLFAAALCVFDFQAHAANLGVGAPGFAVNINFQTKGTLTPSGYLPDFGEEFGDRGNRYAYGWNVPNTANAFERKLSANKLLDSGHIMQNAGQSFSWKIRVPKGLYDVVLGAGDSALRNERDGTRYNIIVENVPVITDAVPSKKSWYFGTNTHIQIWVNDGYLNLSNGPGATNNRICYIQIKQVAPIFWGSAIIDNSGKHKCPVDYESESNPGVLGYYEGHTKKQISLLHWGTSWGSSLASQTNYMDKMWARGTIPVFSWSPAGPGGETNYSLANITAGKHDVFLTNWFRTAKAYGKPFFLNFAREMNGTWYTWSEGHPVNAGCPTGAYVAMWRHVRNICTAVGCTNVSWIWVVDRDITNSKHIGPLKRFYPGDDYVDWVGIDLYNSGQTAPFAGEPFKIVYGQTYSNVVEIAPAKPIMICETATKHLKATPKPAWITEALTELPSAFPNIRAFTWFNWNDGKTNKNWPIQGGDNTLSYKTAPIDWTSVRAFSDGVASPFYLSNIFTNQAHLTASPIRPIVLLPAPTNLVASANSGDVTLEWSAVSGATNYNVYRSTAGKAYDSTPIAMTTRTSYTDSAVVSGTIYYYVITAQNMAGESVDSVAVTATPGAALSQTTKLGSAK